MARKSHEDVFGAAGAETVIGTGVKLTGKLVSDSDIIIDGQLTGEITSTGDVTIGINAKIKADVRGANVTVVGSLTGNIVASGEITIRETGHVDGDITAAGLAITSGGVFSGRSIMEAPPRLGDEPKPAAAAKPTKTADQPVKPAEAPAKSAMDVRPVAKGSSYGAGGGYGNKPQGDAENQR